ncbi:MAG: DUF2336 domain-containing protein, partial [Nitrospinae bacterium]|nr:DUF2336 domain-containing protein [Nitrospinota bacterium]
ADTGDVDVITTLLQNGDAEISRSLMAHLVAESKRIDKFQMPLVNRRDLPPDLAQKMYWWVSAAIRHHIVTTFDIDSATGTLTPTGSVDLESDPCYVSVDATGRHLLSAYYFSGHIAVHPIDTDGALGGQATEWIATRPKAHCAHTDASNNFTFLPHVGESNAIYQYRFDSSTGSLTLEPCLLDALCRFGEPLFPHGERDPAVALAGGTEAHPRGHHDAGLPKQVGRAIG